MDRENVIYDIERCICHVPDACRDCSHYTGTVGFGCMEDLMKDALALLKEQEPYISKETRLNRDEYCNVGDVLDCFDGMDMKTDEVFHAVCLIEWAMSKRSVPLDQLLKEREAVKPKKADNPGGRRIEWKGR